MIPLQNFRGSTMMRSVKKHDRSAGWITSLIKKGEAGNEIYRNEKLIETNAVYDAVNASFFPAASHASVLET